jgi:hypothetical protein
MSEYKFDETEIPYDVLEKFGLTQQMMEDLPEQVLTDLTEGRRTPVLPLKVVTEQEEIRTRARLALMRGEHGATEVMFYPQLIKSNLVRFSDEVQELLRSGKTVLDTATDANGNTVKAFVQIDDATGQVLSVPTPVIGHNLQIVADEFRLSTAEVSCLRNGEILTILDGEEEVTCGLDLNAPASIRLCHGDQRAWREQPRQVFQPYNFGIFGCWTMDAEGNLDYILEADYTEEIWAAMKQHQELKAKTPNHRI